jgi:rod shape determining protein RodA
MSNNNKIEIHKGVDGWLITIYLIMVTIGITSIMAVEHRPGDDIFKQLFLFKKQYSKQLYFFFAALILAIFILLTDSKLFTATANLQYAIGIFLILITFVVGSKVKGTASVIRLGGVQFQAVEIAKIFTALALAKFLSRPETDFQRRRDQLIVMAIALSPAMLSILQNETGVALVYFSFFLMMYREGLPGIYLTLGFSFAFMVILSLLFADKPNIYVIIIASFAAIATYIMRKQIKKRRNIFVLIVLIALGCIGFQKFAMPVIFTKVIKGYQATRIFNTLGMENPYAPKDPTQKPDKKKEDYNVLQSKIAIGSGEFFGKGYMKGTLTTGNFVPEQATDFIFCTIGESFGFLGSFIYLVLYGIFLYRITVIAERQRSTFSRVYAYCIASVFFFHLLINVGMTTGIMPVIGIPLFISYGGTSLLSFTMMLFILIKLDADRQMVLR